MSSVNTLCIIRHPAVTFNCLVGVHILLDHRCGFRRNRLITGHILVLCIRKVLEKNGKMYSVLQRQLSVDLKKGCVSVCIIFVLNLVHSMKLVSCLKICLNESYNKARIGIYLSVSLSDTCGVKVADALSPVLFTFALDYVTG
jgi:hypothetical protein